MSRRSIAAAAGVAALSVSAAAAPIALGHAEVKNRTPKPGSTLSSAPRTIRISFSEAIVTGKFVSITRNGKAVRFSSKLSTHKGAISATPSARLAAGTYRVAWRLKADDGDTQTGHWSFSVR